VSHSDSKQSIFVLEIETSLPGAKIAVGIALQDTEEVTTPRVRRDTQSTPAIKRTNQRHHRLADYRNSLTRPGHAVTRLALTSSICKAMPNRYLRAGQLALSPGQNQLRSNLSVTRRALRLAMGGFTEKHGRIYNFDPAKYSFDDNTGNVTSTGFIVANQGGVSAPL